MATGVYCYQNRCPESIWLYLQRLKLVPSQQRVDKYLKSLPPPVFSPEKFRFAHYDNCGIYLHVMHKHTTHASEYLHLVLRLVLEVSWQIAVTPETMFKTYNGEEMKKFARFLLMDFEDQCDIMTTASHIITKAKDFGLLKLALKDDIFDVDNAELTVLPVEVDKQTISYEDNCAIVRKMWEEIGIPYNQTIGIFGGDWQTFTRMWDMRIKDPILFRFLLPFPGEWHWNWHILKGIFKIWGHYLLKPMACSLLGFKNFDVACKNFHYGEDFLEVLTIGTHQFMEKLHDKHPGMTDIDLLNHYSGYLHLYELLYMWVWHICPYWVTRSALKAGNSPTINQMWRYWLQLFITAKKHNYAIMSIQFVWMMEYLHLELRQLIDDFHTFSFSGAKMMRVPLNGINKLINLHTKAMAGPATTEDKLKLNSGNLVSFLTMRKGLQKLRIHHKDADGKYSNAFRTDANKISKYIMKRIGHNIKENPLEAEYDRDWWYQIELSDDKGEVSPFELCEEGTRQVCSYLVRNQKFIVETREKLVIVGPADPNMGDWESGDEEEEEEGYESD